MSLIDDIIKFANNFKNKEPVTFKPVFYCNASMVNNANKYLPGYKIVELKKIEVIDNGI